MATANLRNFLDGLLSTGTRPPPAFVIVEDYRHRSDLVADLRDEADIHGVRLEDFTTLERLQERVLELPDDEARGALILVDTDAGKRWGTWLDANREKLPDWFVLTLILVMPDELPRMVRHAPSLFSWAKGQCVQGNELTVPALREEDLESSLREMQRVTGMNPEEFIKAWRQGKLRDTHQNSAWLNLAAAFLGESDA